MVVVAFDKTLTYRKVALTTRLIQRGVPYVVTHPDVVCPTKNGYIPDAGSILAMIKAATNIDPLAIMGKPNRMMLDYVMNLVGVKPEDIIVFGDRMYTDIKMACEARIDSVLMITGETKLVSDKAECKPDFVLISFKEIVALLN